jgi:hypothetical protein
MGLDDRIIMFLPKAVVYDNKGLDGSHFSENAFGSSSRALTFP